jgi:4-hydroxy-tetrahydrodipicolinate reductase
MMEKHHKHKKDSPSGTAHLLGSAVIEHFAGKEYLTTSPDDVLRSTNALHISSLRCGDIIGEHEVIADSIIDTISITHSAKNRSGFAQGAILAAEWIEHKKGLHEFSEFFA